MIILVMFNLKINSLENSDLERDFNYFSFMYSTSRSIISYS